ncbi:MAG TPA: secretin N-terminal domain-containing protein [Candidatus Paceibacterota bacterium]|nr:secretin N-terminal domain-containing protein [Candidatus Paceibacterota bacterium]
MKTQLNSTSLPERAAPAAGSRAASITLAVLLAGLTGVPGQDSPPPPAAPPPPPATNVVSEMPTPAAPPPAEPAAPAPEPAPAVPAVSVPAVVTNSAAAPDTPPANPDELRLNFRGVPLEMVLNYLSEAAGFIIVLEAQPRGRVDMWSSQPVTREEAVALLNSVLHKNGLAAIRKGRTLTIINRDEAKIRPIPVRMGSDPESIPDDEEIVTHIIPVRFVEATQLLKDLQPLVSVNTSMTANESGNSIVITDTQSNIRRVAEVIKAIDQGAEDVTEVRVFRLTNADPTEMSELLTSLFPDETRTGGQSQGGGFRSFFRGGFPGGPPGGGGGSSGTQTQRVRKRARVLAVPDARTSSVVVTAAKDLMDQVEQVVIALDEDPARRQTVKVFQLDNADPQEAMEVLRDIFQKSGTQTSRNNRTQTSVLQNRSEQQQNQQTTGTSFNRGGSTRRTSTAR